MATKYKVVSKTAATRRIGKYDVPVEVVALIEDILKIETMIAFLGGIDPQNITKSDTQEQRDFGYDMITSQRTLIRSWHRYAKRRLQTYLAP